MVSLLQNHASLNLRNHSDSSSNESSSNNKKNSTHVVVHRLPCQIDYDGPAKVSNYFIIDEAKEKLENPHNQEQELKEESLQKYQDMKDQEVHSKMILHLSTFRGRGLQGKKIELPKGYKGLIYNSQPLPADLVKERGEDGTFYKIQESFEQIHVWEHDLEPTIKTNKVINVFSYLQLSEDESVMNDDGSWLSPKWPCFREKEKPLSRCTS